MQDNPNTRRGHVSAPGGIQTGVTYSEYRSLSMPNRKSLLVLYACFVILQMIIGTLNIGPSF